MVAYRIAGEYRFSPTSLENFVESQRVVVSVPGPANPNSKFTERARTVFELSSEEARRYNHSGIGTEHLLLGLLLEEESLANQVLLMSGVTLDKAREHVRQLLAEGQ